MKKTSQRGHSTMKELNITPLLDLVFVLLVIFIITTPQMINALTMNLPSGATPPKPPTDAPPPKINHVIVDDKSQVFLNDQFVADDSLMSTFGALETADDPAPKVVVKAMDEVEYQGVIKVLDVLQRLNITNVGLATVQ